MTPNTSCLMYTTIPGTGFKVSKVSCLELFKEPVSSYIMFLYLKSDEASHKYEYLLIFSFMAVDKTLLDELSLPTDVNRPASGFRILSFTKVH